MCLLFVALFTLLHITIGIEHTVVYSWTQVDYDWDNITKTTATTNRSYIMENNIITGIKVYKDTIYVTVPRWKRGIPSTLNKIITKNNKAVLSPYPSWSMQDTNNCNMLQNIQSMEIDPDGKMWILDVGRKYFFDDNGADNTCPPKIIIYDIITDKIIKTHIFPNYIVNHTNSFLNDIVIDVVNKYAYISDLFGSPPYNGGIIVYDYHNDYSHRYSDIVMNFDGNNSPARNITINNYTVYTDSAIDGIALSPDLNWLYFCPLSSYRLYRVPTYDIRSYVNDDLKQIQFIGNRTSNMDGMTFSNKSMLYYGSFHETALNAMKYEFEIIEKNRNNYTRKHAVEVISDSVELQWIDTFAWDNNGYLYFTTNRLHRYFLGNMDWNGGNGANMRIIKVYVGAGSYMMYSENEIMEADSVNTIGIVLGTIFGIFVIGLLSIFIYSRYKKSQIQNNDKFQSLTNNDY
eukprot:80691_1